jgi:hypothetical protein
MQSCGLPNQELRSNLATVELIEHFVPSTFVEIIGDSAHPRFAVALAKGANAFQLLPDWVLAAREQIGMNGL